ncbi:cobalt-precorrin-6A reductase [Tropicimonas sp.]|uniref:cobalt-precorrin-6A reductase n=1 Tax=Tropicimonas sp. TaxID=2067044 RepID=UPI003A89CE70
MSAARKRLLLLGGTSEARALARALAGENVDVTVSLAGATRRPAPVPGRLRTGGFGGAGGLAAYMRDEGIAALVDATHPFARTIAANAVAAAGDAGCQMVRLSRPAWRPGPGDRWLDFPDLATALNALPPGSRTFLATGSGTRAALAMRPDLDCVLRSIEPLEGLSPRVTHIVARPPFDESEERSLFRREAVTHLVARNSGGTAGLAKLRAARSLGLPVLMIARPAPPPGVATVASVEAALGWLRERLSLDTSSGAAP